MLKSEKKKNKKFKFIRYKLGYATYGIGRGLIRSVIKMFMY